MTDGNGETIPCRCRYGGHRYRLGETVCMRLPQGTVLARCDLLHNNTSWVTTGTGCEVSWVVPGATRFPARSEKP
jgi:hypothetical protein